MPLILEILLKTTGFLLLLRFMVELARADFYSPWTQGIVKLTDILCRGLRRFLPATSRFDTSSVLVAWAVYTGLTFIELGARGVGVPVAFLPAIALIRLVDTTLFLYWLAILVVAIMSWIDPARNFPVTRFAGEVAQPLLEPARRLLPPFGVVDLSPIVVFLALFAVRTYVVPPLQNLFF
ncbi:MAG: YggT family protein [Pseudomonadales bacterium]|nr:YggT family protein [Pseudomonadales bacterium]